MKRVNRPADDGRRKLRTRSAGNRRLHRRGAEPGERETVHLESIAFPIFLAVSIGIFNQLSGINAILYYLNDIFAHAGFSKVSGNLQAVAIGATNLLFTMIAMSVIDRLGRKTLLLVGSVGTAACLAGVSVIFFTGQHQSLLVWLLVGYIAFFAFSQGAVIWVYLSEVFPNSVRAKGQSLGSFSHWFMNAAISLIFPLMAASSGAYPVRVFLGDDGGAVLCGAVCVSGDQRACRWKRCRRSWGLARLFGGRHERVIGTV